MMCARAGVLGALHGVDADAADAEDDDGVARPDLGRVDRRAPAGRHAAADQRGLLQRDVVVDLHARSCAETTARSLKVPSMHIAPRSCSPEWKRNVPSIRQPDEQVGAAVAQVLVAGGAPPAAAAGRAGTSRRRGRPGRCRSTPSPTCSTTPAPSWPPTSGTPPGQVARAQVVVGVAHARRGELDEHLAGLRRVQVELDHVPRLSGFPHHGCASLHGSSRQQNVIRLLGRYLA